MEICVIENSKAIHKFKPDQLECIWPLFMKHRNKCGTEEEKEILNVGHVCDPVMVNDSILLEEIINSVLV